MNTNKINKTTTGCWEWTGSTFKGTGYPLARRKGKNALAHRVIFEEETGKVIAGLALNRSCKNKMCVNPDHMILGSEYHNQFNTTTPTVQAAPKIVKITVRQALDALGYFDTGKLATGRRQITAKLKNMLYYNSRLGEATHIYVGYGKIRFERHMDLDTPSRRGFYGDPILEYTDVELDKTIPA